MSFHPFSIYRKGNPILNRPYPEVNKVVNAPSYIYIIINSLWAIHNGLQVNLKTIESGDFSFLQRLVWSETTIPPKQNAGIRFVIMNKYCMFVPHKTMQESS